MAPSVALESPQFQAGLKTNTLQETVEVEPKSKEVISSIDLKESVPLQLSIIKEHRLYDHQLEFQSSCVSSHLQSSPKKGLLSISILTSIHINP